MGRRSKGRTLPASALVLAGIVLAVSGGGLALAVSGGEASQASAQAKIKGRLVAAVGPGFTIKVTKAGKAVKTLKIGRYRITIRDRSSDHDFHLIGPGVNKKTRVAFTGTVVWKSVKLKKGTYRFVCDAHPSEMKGSFKVTATGGGGGATTNTSTVGGTTGSTTTSTTNTNPYGY